MSKNPYSLSFDEFSKLKAWRFKKVPDPASLNHLVVEELVSMLKGAAAQKKSLMAICPVGPLDYSFWVERLNQEQIDGSFLITVNMDEYLDKEGNLLEESHPLSFCRFMRESACCPCLGLQASAQPTSSGASFSTLQARPSLTTSTGNP